MSKAKTVANRLQERVPDGKRMIVKDAAGRKVLAFEAGEFIDQALPPGHRTEMLDLPAPAVPGDVDPFVRIPPRLAIEALLELVGVSKTELVAKANEVRGGGRAR